MPTTVNLLVKNLDAVDIAATNISCTNLTVAGNPISNIFQNVTSTTGSTTFTGSLTADTITSNGAVNSATLVTSGTASTGALTATSINTPGSVSASSVAATGDVSGATLTGTVNTATQNSITKIGTQTSFACSGTISQTAGTATFQSTTVGALSTTGNISQTGTGVSNLGNTTISTGNKLQFAGTAVQQKIDLYSGTYGIGVSANQLNLVSPTAASLNYYGGGTNNDGTLRFNVNTSGRAFCSSLPVCLSDTTLQQISVSTATVTLLSGAPTDVNAFTVALGGLTGSALAYPRLQCAYSGGTYATGYSGSTWTSSTTFTHNTFIPLAVSAFAAGTVWHCTLHFTRNVSNYWTYHGMCIDVNGASGGHIGGTVPCASGLDRFVLTMSAGNVTAVLGSVNYRT